MKMSYMTRVAIMLGVSMLVGCASIQPTVMSSAVPDPASGYLAGTFSRVSSGGFAFVVKNMRTGEEFGMPLGEDGLLPKDVNNQVIAIKLPPGDYAVTEWYTYATLTKERSAKKPISNRYLAMPFKVEAGKVMYLGYYLVSTSSGGGYTYWTVKPRPIGLSEAKAAFASAYPAFVQHDFACQLCLDTVPLKSEP